MCSPKIFFIWFSFLCWENDIICITYKIRASDCSFSVRFRSAHRQESRQRRFLESVTCGFLGAGPGRAVLQEDQLRHKAGRLAGEVRRLVFSSTAREVSAEEGGVWGVDPRTARPPCSSVRHVHG